MIIKIEDLKHILYPGQRVSEHTKLGRRSEAWAKTQSRRWRGEAERRHELRDGSESDFVLMCVLGFECFKFGNEMILIKKEYDMLIRGKYFFLHWQNHSLPMEMLYSHGGCD